MKWVLLFLNDHMKYSFSFIIIPLLAVQFAFSGATIYPTIDEAIARGDLADVETHLSKFPDSLNQGKRASLTPLHQAILRKQRAIALHLIKSGADVDAVDKSQRSPLHLCVERDLPDLISALLLAKAKPDTWDKAGWTPLHNAAAKDRVVVAKALIAGGAKLTALSERGGTALHEAAASANSEMVELLLSKGLPIDVIANDGRTALEVAQAFMNKAAIRAISEQIARLSTTVDWKPSFNDKPVPQERLEAIEAALPDIALAPPDSPRKILIFSATAGFRHASIATGKVALDRMGIKTGAYQALISDDPENFEVDVLNTFDAVVLLSPTLDFFMPSNKLRKDFSEAQWDWLHARHKRLIANLVQFVHAGGGLVGIHAATDSCYKDKDYGDMIGGYFWGHPWSWCHNVTVMIEDSEHALIKPVFGDMPDFRIQDEIYQFKEEPYSREKLRVLLSLDLERSDEPMPKVPLRRTCGDYAISWVQSMGEGRVFYTSLGHNHHIFTDPLMLKHYLAGIQFAIGDLEADTSPSASLEK